MEVVQKVLSVDSLTPRGQSYSWDSGMIWTNVVSDGLLAFSFFVIAFVSVYLARKREKQESRLLLCFGLFFFCCGLTHLLQIVTVWQPAYWLEGIIKLTAALTALAAAAALLLAAPAVLAIPTRRRWDRTNRELQQKTSQLREKDEAIRQSKEALQEAEERYGVLKQLFDSTIIHVDRKIVFANPAAVKLLGASHPDQLIGRSILSFTHPDYLTQVQARLADAERHQAVPLMEQKIVRLDGKVTHIEATAAAITYKGRPATQTIIRDITERKEQEKKLQISEAKFRGVFESEVIGIAIINADGFFSEANAKFAHLTGYSQQEILSGVISWMDTSPAEHWERDQQAIRELRQTGKITPYEREGMRKDGSYIPVLIAGSRLDKQWSVIFVADLTEQQKARRRLALSEDRFKLLTEATHDVIWDADLSTGSLWWNDNYKKQFGYPQAEPDATVSWYGRVHPEDLERVSITMQQAEADGHNQWVAEYRFRRADGTYANILDRAYIINDPDGKPVRAIGSMVDVTALKKTQAELAIAQERFQLVAKATNDFVYDWDMPTDAMWWNEQFRAQFGYREEDLKPGATAWTDRLHPDDRTQVWDQIHEAFRERNKQVSFEYRFLKPDGTYAYILERGYVLYNGAGLPFRMVGSMADLSPLKQAQQELEEKAFALQQYNLELEESEVALRESLSKFQAVFDSDMIGIFFWNANGQVIDANDEYLSVIGYSRQDLEAGQLNWRRLTPPEYHHLDEKALVELAETGVNRPYEKEYFRKDGSRVAVIVGSAPLEGYTDLGIGFLLNISERKKADWQLQHTLEELKKRNYELDTYVYKVSHDLRAPLASILGLINILKDEQDLDAVRNYISLVENRAQKLDVFIQSILAHSRTNSTEIQVNSICFDKIIRESFEDLKYLPRFENVKLTVQLEGENTFHSDELKVSIILKNFLSNAIKYSNPYAPEPFVHFSIMTAPTEAAITIRDNGIGIDPQYVGRIFDMFFRATEKSDGSGLGLYIVKQTIEKLGGSITVESAPGKGTTFRIVLPNLKVPELQYEK